MERSVPPVLPRPRISNACEPCRSAKVKCMASNQLGICKRCLNSKRECVFPKGPRPRRSRPSKRDPSKAISAPSNLPPKPGPSQTFTIDIPMTVDGDVAEDHEELRLLHEGSISDLVPHISSDEDADEDGEEYDLVFDYDRSHATNLNLQQSRDEIDWPYNADQTSASGSAISPISPRPADSGPSNLLTPPESGTPNPALKMATGRPRTKTRMVASLGLQPQFNLESASKLLDTFRNVMLKHYHCVVIRDEDTIAGLSQSRPFVLLAVLAAASGSCTLQGHSLYDEEFRKILGLKFVTGGERSLELLQGLLVYVAWYSFHLRPKNRHAQQYIRMAVDIVVDLEINEDPSFGNAMPTPERLDEMRAYVSTYYLTSSVASTWGRTPPLQYTAYTAKCCELLEKCSTLPGDHCLAWQVRLQRLVEETNQLRLTQRGHSQTEYQIDRMICGMETQLHDWETNLSTKVSDNPSVRIALLFTRIFLSGAPLLKLPSVKLPVIDASSAFRADPQRLLAVIPHLHKLYEYFLSLPSYEINSFVGIEWSALIMSIILGFRMSFTLVVCPEWDDCAARNLIRFDEYLDRLCNLGAEATTATPTAAASSPSSKNSDHGTKNQQGKPEEPVVETGSSSATPLSMDVLTASKVVFQVVRRKFLKKVAKVEEQRRRIERRLNAYSRGMPQQSHHDPTTGGCPMMDGSLGEYFGPWDETFLANPTNVNNLQSQQHSQAQSSQLQQQQRPPPIYNDIWPTMTMVWSQEGAGDGTVLGFERPHLLDEDT